MVASGDADEFRSRDSLRHVINHKQKIDIEETSTVRRGRSFEELRNVLWRDVIFLLMGVVALQIVAYIETHAADADIRGGEADSGGEKNQCGIVDAGFILTAPINSFLSAHRGWNNALALLNSLVLIVPTVYTVYVTLWKGDYTLSFRLIASQLFRSLCGWFTYLPPDPTFIMSYYDFPEVAQCLFRDCPPAEEISKSDVLPFVSFFSGHVATTVTVANHMYISGFYSWSVALHVFNVFQIIRLLATRGHYSIDIIIGWCVAVYVSTPAERLGRHYSRGMKWSDVMPGNRVEAFETFIGVSDMRIGRQSVRTLHYHEEEHHSNLSPISNEVRPGVEVVSQRDHDEYYSVQSDTATRIAADMATDFAKRSLNDLREDLTRVGLQMAEIRDLRRNDLIRMAELARLKMAELRSEARKLDISLAEGMSRREILARIVAKVKGAMEKGLEETTNKIRNMSTHSNISDDGKSNHVTSSETSGLRCRSASLDDAVDIPVEETTEGPTEKAKNV
eukprot:scaffold2027_cov52-Attheya_sp.AAC.1